MWCNLYQRECYRPYCDGNCFEFSTMPQLFNYKCPDCHGEFMQPISEETGETKLVDITEIGNPNIVARQLQSILRYKCPFCGRKMEGM